MTKICAVITESTSDAMIEVAEKAASKGAEIVELRLDYVEDLNETNLKKIIETIKTPKIATLRPERDGGKYKGEESERINQLLSAVDLGVEYIDLELSSDVGWRYELSKKAKDKRTGLIISFHDFNETPTFEKLNELVRNAFAAGATIAKVSTTPKNFDDVLKILQLINDINKEGKKIIGIGMGTMGKLTRLPIDSGGNYMTYVSMSETQESAAGQINMDDALELSRLLNK